MDNLIFHTAFVGDLLLTIPFIGEVRRRWRDDRVTLVCRPGLKKFFLENKIVDQVIELEKGDAQSEADFLQAVQKMDIRNLFCPHQSFRSAWLLRRLKAQNKIAYKVWWNRFFFNRRVLRPIEQPEVLRLWALFGAQDEAPDEVREITNGGPSDKNLSTLENVTSWPVAIEPRYSLVVAAQAKAVEGLLARLSIRRPFVVIAPGSQWATKRWTAEGFAAVSQATLGRGLNVYLVGSQKESVACADVIGLIQSKDRVTNEIRSLAGQTDLFELHALMSASEYVVANDSGSMHMAVASGRPVVGVFGPTVLAQGYRPWSDRAAVAQIALPCRPCGRHGHQQCPIGTHDCMKKLTAEKVLSAIEAVRH